MAFRVMGSSKGLGYYPDGSITAKEFGAMIAPLTQFQQALPANYAHTPGSADYTGNSWYKPMLIERVSLIENKEAKTYRLSKFCAYVHGIRVESNSSFKDFDLQPSREIYVGVQVIYKYAPQNWQTAIKDNDNAAMMISAVEWVEYSQEYAMTEYKRCVVQLYRIVTNENAEIIELEDLQQSLLTKTLYVSGGDLPSGLINSFPQWITNIPETTYYQDTEYRKVTGNTGHDATQVLKSYVIPANGQMRIEAVVSITGTGSPSTKVAINGVISGDISSTTTTRISRAQGKVTLIFNTPFCISANEKGVSFRMTTNVGKGFDVNVWDVKIKGSDIPKTFEFKRVANAE